MLGYGGLLVRFIRRRSRVQPLRPNRAVITFFVALFTVAVVIFLYEGLTTGNYLLIALVIVAYVFVLLLEARLSLGQAERAEKSKPAKKPRDNHPR